MVVTGAKRNQCDYIAACDRQGLSYKILEGRPDNCPKAPDWKYFENHRLFRLGKDKLCRQCGQRLTCDHWKPLEEVLRGSRLYFTTASKVTSHPGFLASVMKSLGTVTPLTLIDEASYVMSARQISVSLREARLLVGLTDGQCQKHLEQLVLEFSDDTHNTPLLSQLLKSGLDMEKSWEKAYRRRSCPLQALTQVLAAQPRDRWLEQDQLTAILRPDIFSPAIITAQNLSRLIIEHFADLHEVKLQTPQFNNSDVHCGSKIINFKTSFGSHGHFSNNASTIIHNFLPFLIAAVKAGQRTLLVCKQGQIPKSRSVLEAAIKKLNLAWTVVTSSDPDFDTYDFTVTPCSTLVLIHYNLAGVNSFEHFENVLCLSAYYTREDILNNIFNSVHRPEQRVLGRIAEDSEGYRTARISGEGKIFQGVYEDLFNALERDTVLNTVGRVRLWTHPRTVVLQQKTRFHLQKLITVESFGELHDALGTVSQSLPNIRKRFLKAELVKMRAERVDVAAAASAVGISPRTAYRYLATENTTENTTKCAISPLIYI
ncbi:MAG: hypothetical protein HQL31_01320 [Planctomycetes bacterium]|nr:hypothetical protein [Planctomycetota bacterium]